MQEVPGDLSLVRSVLHPTDLGPGSEAAFEHALAIALLRQTKLTLLHVGKPDAPSGGGDPFPSVRATLARWGLLDKDSPRRAVYESFKVRVKKQVVRGRPLEAILRYAEQEPADLVVLATRGKEGAPGWLKPSVSRPLAHRSETMTLFIPRGSRGFVDAASGNLSARKILVPVAAEPSGQPAIVLAARVALASHGIEGEPVEITTLHVGEGELPPLDYPETPGCRWSRVVRKGNVIDEIVGAAERLPADLIVMASDGRNGILDALRGSHSEQVLRRALCPLLVVPITAHERPLLVI